MNILDEQILESQRQLLRSWRIPIRQIGYDIGRKGMKDREIIPFLLQLSRPTFFSLDSDFAKKELCHHHYSLVCMDVRKHEAAIKKRLYKVICLSHTNIAAWLPHSARKQYEEWND